MLRQLAVIFLFLAFAAQIFNRAVIVLDYYANTASFAKNCENKARPVMRCKGKCQMMKKLEEEEKKEQQNPNRKIDNQDQVVFSKSSFSTLPVFTVSVSRSFASYYRLSFPKGIYDDVFHPPSAA